MPEERFAETLLELRYLAAIPEVKALDLAITQAMLRYGNHSPSVAAIALLHLLVDCIAYNWEGETRRAIAENIGVTIGDMIERQGNRHDRERGD